MVPARSVVLSWFTAALLLAGCGSGRSLLSHSGSAQVARNQPNARLPNLRAIPAPPATGAPADPAAVNVIKAWSSALQRGNVRTAASLFNLPSEFVNGGGASVPVIRIRTLAEAEAVNATLPCGAKLISSDQRGKYINALFKLTGRRGPGGSDCGSGAGTTARTNFVIEHGRIVEWIRAPDDPGDNGSPKPPGNPTSPSPTPIV